MLRKKISKACQECRARKVRCDGLNPCSPCQQRNTACVFRERARVRRGATDSPSDEKLEQHPGDQPAVVELHSIERQRHQPSDVYKDVHKSVSARQRSPSGSVELYYGPTSDFSLLQHLYHTLYLSSASDHNRNQQEEVGQGLDFFRVRHIFFGQSSMRSAADVSVPANRPLPPPHIAHTLLNQFLATHYNIVPFYPKTRYDQLLKTLYATDHGTTQFSEVQQHICIMAMATAAANTEHFQLGVKLAEYVEGQRSKMQYVVSLECIQLGILMAMFNLEYAQSNIAYMIIGDTSRKAFAAGLHRQQTHLNEDDSLETMERQHTFSSLYFMEIWISFYLGRPSMLEYFNTSQVPRPQDIFLSALLQFATVMMKIVHQVYRPQAAPSVLWNCAMAVGKEMDALRARARTDFGLELDAPRSSDPRGMRPVVLITLYNFMSFLLFRPFVIIRGKVQTEISKQPDHQPPPELPSWLNNACINCLNAARTIVSYICNIAADDPLLRELRFNCFYLENCLFLLLYDMASNPENRVANSPLVHQGLQFLTRMRQGDPVCSSIATIRRILQHMNLDVGAEELTLPHAAHSPHDPVSNVSQPPPQLEELIGPIPVYPQGSAWAEQPQQALDPRLGASDDFQFDLDLSAADFNVDITAIDWDTFFSYVPS
ncbi:hypothetical protein BO85DRAFT_521754 [Aspergillus piperis CBS 112811]|uniref:Zn(2)-C6 fungal-type domain-containing protein n=1 Tax=Aspergillus piperis CBS 112811 TaxID=1448313 RepID=A0A8G1VL17_9EURO|nr:hypothetical protein BO85DRAFT_521754 [Aspergillus piperis CBS 112811]RAH55927.1 hypothetical protein BO85DRAFT_521754 [Aspergillus piperis CBS 112811]